MTFEAKTWKSKLSALPTYGQEAKPTKRQKNIPKLKGGGDTEKNTNNKKCWKKKIKHVFVKLGRP